MTAVLLSHVAFARDGSTSSVMTVRIERRVAPVVTGNLKTSSVVAAVLLSEYNTTITNLLTNPFPP